MKRILIANRGEIAVRIIRACREMGISPVAVYSDADQSSPFVALADAAYRIGPGPAAESYLCIDRIIDAARISGADGIHPGYGFLSENADFARACDRAGLAFIGPSGSAIRSLGDKSEAKRRMRAAGVPCVPGYLGGDQSQARLSEEARKLGYPLLVKAAAGGGGRGMRLVSSEGELMPGLDEASREAQSAFGDPRLLLEKYIQHPRHVEFQVFGDRHGDAIHLFERECSIQRRHQKIIEESPSPVMTPELRSRMAEAAVTAARAFSYSGAGTVEFLVEEQPDGSHSFYFLEVNTRLQVEHPVTEMRTGTDLVKLQIRVARGEPLPYCQDQVQASGHSIEARIYAEDPETGFLPSVGRLAHWKEPSGPGIRVDSGVEQGSEISPFYDPMLAKLIVHGEDRNEAIGRLEQALLQFEVLGVRTNIEYLIDIVRHPAFREGRTHTGFLEEHFSGWKPDTSIPAEVLLALAAEAVTRPSSRRDFATTDQSGDAFSPWKFGGTWRNAAS